jgi:hypothetical protein
MSGTSDVLLLVWCWIVFNFRGSLSILYKLRTKRNKILQSGVYTIVLFVFKNDLQASPHELKNWPEGDSRTLYWQRNVSDAENVIEQVHNRFEGVKFYLKD